MVILIDFDGTVVSHEFPEIGKDIGAVPVLRELVDNGHHLILFTMRSDISGVRTNDTKIVKKDGKYLSKAVQWFEKHDIPLYGIQTNPSQKEWTTSPKAYGQLIIDDISLGIPLKHDLQISERPFVDWDGVRKLLVERNIL